MTGQKPTKADASPPSPEKWTLTPQQETAVDLLVLGRTLTDVAAEIGVTRQTVSEWTNHHLGFQAAVNARRRDLWEQQTDRLRNLLPKSLQALEEELEGDNRLQAALGILRATGLYNLSPPDGPKDTQELQVVQEEKKSQLMVRYLAATWKSGTGRT